ncbi:MAG: LLM class flavin-dependent oxidoreductase [Chloroflexi bacterium]|nr:LLM class flavin-dependent oxidoreductase [Chloroflexota bacterium]MDA1146695.1 LLM class flavin-dependent oxidoreductase [Chloroflexota bacterium]
MPWLGVIASHTSKIELGTSILNCFSRTPATLAQEFSTLDQISEGRAVLGLGSSGEFVIEHFHGLPFSKPLRRLREYVDIFNMLMSGEPLNYEGEIFQMGRGFQLRTNTFRKHVPVYIAAITPRSIRQTGEIADGIIPIHWPQQHFETLRSQLAEGAAVAGRDVSALTIAAQVHLHVLDGSNDEEEWRAARQPLQYYINRMGVFYWQMLSRNGFEAEVAASRAAWAERDAEGSFAAITDEMVREIEVIGSLEEIHEQLQHRSELGADLQMLHMPEGSVADVGKTLEASPSRSRRAPKIVS